MKTAHDNTNQLRQDILALIHAQPGRSTLQLATELSLSRNTVKKMLSTLERKGFVSHRLVTDSKGCRSVWRALRDFDAEAFKQGPVRRHSGRGVIVHRCDDSASPYRNQGGQGAGAYLPRRAASSLSW